MSTELLKMLTKQISLENARLFVVNLGKMNFRFAKSNNVLIIRRMALHVIFFQHS